MSKEGKYARIYETASRNIFSYEVLTSPKTAKCKTGCVTEL